MIKKVWIALDIDGTIFDAGNIVVEAFENGVGDYLRNTGASLHIPTHSEIVAVLGLTMDDIFIELYPSLNKKERSDLMVYCTHSFVELIRAKKGNIFDGVQSTVKSLYSLGYGLLVASNGKREYVQAILDTYDLTKYFNSTMYYPEELGFDNQPLVTKSDVVASYRKGLAKDDPMVMIGDRYTDRDAAKDNGIPFIGCAFGHVGDEEISHCRWVVSRFDEINDILKNIVAEF